MASAFGGLSVRTAGAGAGVIAIELPEPSYLDQHNPALSAFNLLGFPHFVGTGLGCKKISAERGYHKRRRGAGGAGGWAGGHGAWQPAPTPRRH